MNDVNVEQNCLQDVAHISPINKTIANPHDAMGKRYAIHPT